MKEKVTLNRKEQQRLVVLNQVLAHKLGVREAAGLLSLSLRHVKRLLAAYRKEGAEALEHGNRGRKPTHALESGGKAKIVELASTTYVDFNNQHFTELLAEREGITISRSSVRRILLEAGIKSPRRRCAPKHRSRRERYPQEGMLLQIDGSRHDWLEGRGPYLTLIGAIDDATGTVPYALFREQEDAQGYFILLQRIVQSQGIPGALYHDGHSIFKVSEREPESLAEQLEGRRWPTQFGRLMEELGIISISAASPQAKGRIERLWGTFQDRLVSELRLAGASTIEHANQVLRDFLPRYNQRFAVSAGKPGAAYRQPEAGFIPEEVFCFKYHRTVGLDNVVRFGEYRLQLLPTNGRASYARARVEVHERLDGSLAVYYQGQCLTVTPAPPEAPVLRARSIPRVIPNSAKTIEPPAPVQAEEKTVLLMHSQHIRPGPNHPWRRPFKVHIDGGRG